MLDVLKLLGEQQATNRGNFAQSQADRAEAAATKPQQWTAQGRDANSGNMALAANGDESKFIGSRITSGLIKPGQPVRVNGDGRTVTVDQKPHKQPQAVPGQPQSEAVPYWVAFGTGFAVSYDTEAATFTESQYPEYPEQPAKDQGDRMFPYGLVQCFVAASATLWVVSGLIGYDPYNNPQQYTTIRFPSAVSSDQGKTWQVSDQFLPYNPIIGSNRVSNLVFGAGYFFAVVNGTQIYRSEDGLTWEFFQPLAALDNFSGVSLAVWNGAVFLLEGQSTLYDGAEASSGVVLKQVLVYAYDDTQSKPAFVLTKTLPFGSTAQYGAYDDYDFYPIHDLQLNYFGFSSGLFPFLFSSNDFDAIPDYGSAIYRPDRKTLTSLLHQGTNQAIPIVYADHIDGQVFLMVSQRWGYSNSNTSVQFGFAAMHEGIEWRTCEHPFVGKIADDGFDFAVNDVLSVAYSATLQRWLVYAQQSYVATGGVNGDSWSEPFVATLTTTLNRPALDTQYGNLQLIASQIKAYAIGGNAVS